MSSSNRTARSIAIPYFVMGIPAFINLMYIPNKFFVAGDATATARNITAGELTYRVGILSGLISEIGFIFLALALYNLFKDFDRKQARFLVSLVLVSAAVGTINLVNDTAPLIFLSGADFLSAFTKPQLDALAMGFLRLRGAGLELNAAFWGLWLFPFGVLVMKSGFIPKLIGYCLIAGGFAYLAVSFTSIVFPEYRQIISQIALPFYAIGEVPILAWFVIKGGNVPLPTGPRPQVS